MTKPIVIIGAARSGTKFLRDVLAGSGAAKAVPYDVNYVWRTGQQGALDDCLEPCSLTPKAVEFIPKTLRHLAGIAPSDTNTILIEKTVSNALRVPFVAAVLPSARFVHLTRDGRDVTRSAMAQWQAKPDWRAWATKLKNLPLSNLDYCLWFAKNLAKRDGIWGPRYRGIGEDLKTKALDQVCAAQWRHCVEESTTAFTNSSTLNSYTITYEDLVGDRSALEDLCAWLDLPDTASVLARYDATLAPPQATQRGDYADLEPLLRQLGYAV